MQFKEARKKSSPINITSLIDVLFILLIFFMVTSHFIDQPGMKLELPETKTHEITRVENFSVFVSKDGEIFLNNQPVTLDDLGAELVRQVPEANQKALVLKADKLASHGLIIQVMDAAKQSGFKKIVIGTQTDVSGL